MALVLLTARSRSSVTRVVEMLLVHDLVEIDAGDTFVYDTAAAEQKEQLELRAAGHLFSMVPGDEGRLGVPVGTSTRLATTPEASSPTRSTGCHHCC